MTFYQLLSANLRVANALPLHDLIYFGDSPAFQVDTLKTPAAEILFLFH